MELYELISKELYVNQFTSTSIDEIIFIFIYYNLYVLLFFALNIYPLYSAPKSSIHHPNLFCIRGCVNFLLAYNV